MAGSSSINAELSDAAEDTPLHPSRSGRSRLQSLVEFFCCRNSRDIIMALIACLGAMSMGFCLGYSSPALQDAYLMKLLNNEVRRSWFGSLLTIGAMVGGPLGALLVGLLGRKTTLILCNVPLTVGWFFIIYATNIVLLYTGRLLTGAGIGAASMAAPLYVAEVAAANRRGPLGTAFQLLVTVGISVCYAVGSVVSWSWLAVAGASLCFLHAILLLKAPETPRYLLANHDREAAYSSLTYLRGRNDIDEEFMQIEEAIATAQLQQQQQQLHQQWSFLTPSVYRPLLVSLALMFFQQASGINAVIFYTSQIFTSAGFSSNPNLPTMIVGVVLVVSTFLSVVVADVAGRRVLLLTSGSVMTASVGVLGAYFYVTEKHQVQGLGWLSLVSLLVYVAFFSLGWGPLPWLVTAEVLPVRAKSYGGGIATACNWFFAFLTTKEFESLELALHNFGAFWLFAGICLVGVVFVFFYVPETKGKSLEEIEAEFATAA